MGWFSRKRQEVAHVHQDPLYVPPTDITYCSCGCETMICRNCFRNYCPHCDLSHVVDTPSFGLQWACDLL